MVQFTKEITSERLVNAISHVIVNNHRTNICLIHYTLDGKQTYDSIKIEYKLAEGEKPAEDGEAPVEGECGGEEI